MKKIYDNKASCYGCTACVNLCPKQAVTMKTDEKGFAYPSIDETLCIECGLCQKVCPYGKDISVKDFEQKYYAVQHVSKDIVYNSSSGGFYTALSDEVLACEGVVYGAYFDMGFVVRHGRATKRMERDRFVGSKYVQSDMADIMKDILQDLENGKQVLFTGTPCQVAGVSNYIKAKRRTLNGLLLCDFICHGASSPLIWSEYISYINGKYKDGVTRYCFRGKKEGWHQRYPLIYSKDKEISLEYRKNKSYILLYQTCFLNRESCYTCQFTSYNRMSDITMADFWNIGKISPEMDDNRGTSEILVNTLEGMKWFERCKDNLRYVECSKDDVWQPHLEYPNAVPTKREQFWQEYSQNGFEVVLEKYGKGDIMTKLKNAITPIAKKIGIYVWLGKLYQLLFIRREKKNGE